MSQPSPSCPRSPLAQFPIILLLAMAATLFYSRLGCELLEPEEARYAEIPRQMLEQGRFVTPVLHGDDYYQKPPLLYWLVMLSYTIFGVHDWAARLVPCTCGVFVVLLAYWWGRRAIDCTTGLIGGLILCLSARFVYLGGMVAMDAPLCLWVTAALALAHLAVTEKRLAWWLLSALACGLGVLTKGPVAATLVVVPIGTWMLLNRQCGRFRWKWWLLYAGVTVATALPWYATAALRAPEAAGDFFWLHNIVRYLAPFDHEKPAWFYVPGLVAGMLPWSLLLLPMARDWIWRWRGSAARFYEAGPNEERTKRALKFFVIAFAWCLLFFSLSGCKRAAYILPAFPLLAMALGTYLVHGMAVTHWRRWVWGFATVYVVLLVASLQLLPEYHRRFGMRFQVQEQADVAVNMPVVCLPKRWNSVSFYLQRGVDVEKEESLAKSGPALVFVKRETALEGMLHALPAHWEFVPRGGQRKNVAVGVIRPKRSESRHALPEPRP
ncbi:MAG: glycosyltransferase family 39 protein [Planctomycetes bacterium]|nr:glycosyltransferase family 39 protein [Planctomycetota bacterium]